MTWWPAAGVGRAACAVAALLWATPGFTGVSFREIETVAGEPPGGESRQVRHVYAAADNCKVLLEESTDALLPVGSYILASAMDAFLVDPAQRTIAPLDPIAMAPVSPAAPAGGPTATAVEFDRVLDEPGPVLLGLPTRHLVFRLRYRDSGPPAVDAAGRRDERHEIWVTPWPEEPGPPAAWQRLRMAEDAGTGPGRDAVVEALEALYGEGLVLRQVIERRALPAGAAGGEAEVERVVREVSEVRRAELPAGLFDRPEGYAQTEFLAPEEEPGPGGGPGGAMASGGPRGPAGR